MIRAAIIVVMGVSGSGKTTIGRLLARELGWPFEEGDELHPPANVAKMKAGIPLDDNDRRPWLEAVADWIDRQRRAGAHGVITSSALKKAYRDRIVGSRPDVGLVYLRGGRDLIASRLARRHGHFMPPSLLDSQFATLEEPGPEEHAVIIDVEDAPEATVEEILARLRGA
jgi:carbohydrate kinase (thermoresistant glucokinase family)